jgi:hypothetical protein
MSNPARTSHSPWLRWLRDWHRWLGVIIAIPVVAIGVTGILLGHKDLTKDLRPTLSWFGGPTDVQPVTEESASTPDVPAGDIGCDAAIAIAEKQWDGAKAKDAEIKRTELMTFYRVKGEKGRELYVAAATGEVFDKRGFEKQKEADKRVVDAKKKDRERAAKGGQGDWQKLVKEIHTGKAFGKYGRFVSDGIAVVLLFLTGSGIYMWIKPLLIRRHKAAAKSAVQPRPTASVST